MKGKIIRTRTVDRSIRPLRRRRQESLIALCISSGRRYIQARDEIADTTSYYVRFAKLTHFIANEPSFDMHAGI